MAEEEPKKYRNTLIFPAALDPDAVKIIQRLRNFDHTAYLVGGCVRDLLLGHIPKDFDVATSARPRQIRRIFKNSKIIGRRFKLAHLFFGEKIIEVSTFRKLPELETQKFRSDGLLILRDNVYGNECDDALRRDFTINALFYDTEREEVVDYVSGFQDIQNKIIRTIGDPHIRFQEDPVRILRAIRFSCRLGLDIDPAVYDTMRRYAVNLQKSAAQRVTEEVIRLLACGAARKSLEIMMEIGPFAILFPEINQVLDKDEAYFGWDGSGRDFLLQLAGMMDLRDKGRRIFENPLFLALLFCHFAGDSIQAAMNREGGPRDPGVILNNTLRPIALHMGVSRRDISCIKQILIAYPKMEASKKKRRFKIMDYIRRDYFPDALEFYRQVVEAKGGNLDRYHWWVKRRQEVRGGSENKPVASRRRRRRNAPRRRRQERPKQNPHPRQSP